LLLVASASVALAIETHAQSAERRAWFTAVGVVRATEDGWVELQFGASTPLAPHYPRLHERGGSARFAPVQARAFAERARRAVNDTVLHVGRIGIPGLTSGSASIGFAVVRDSTGTRFDMYVAACRHTAGSGPSRTEVLLLADALTNASRVASRLRTVPADRGQGPFSRPDVTCPARMEHAAIPAWSQELGHRPAGRGETVAHFVVSERGRIELATLSWDRALDASVEQRARDALAKWRYEPAQAESRRVRQWAHAIIWFADSTDADERMLAGWTRTRSFVARSDGRVAVSPFYARRDSTWPLDETPLFREAYPPAAVRAWLTGLAAPDSDRHTLSVPNGVARQDDNRGGAYYAGCLENGTLSTRGIVPSTREVELDSVRATIAQAEQVRLRPVDSTRLHGETEVTCAARPQSSLRPQLSRWRGPGEVVLTFVVTRDGRVDPTAMNVIGSARARSDLAVAREALVVSRWEPGRLAGVPVPQRVHLVLYPDGRRGENLASEGCAQASTAAVSLHVREPVRGIDGVELTRLAYAMSQQLGLRGEAPPYDGTFSVVIDEASEAHFFSWVRAPTDPSGASLPRETIGGKIVDLFSPVLPAAEALPVALEGRVARTCE
jgi:hypothetical protein